MTAIAAAAALWRLDAVPDGLHADEASIVWNARLIAAWGQDEHARRWPLFFEAFGDFKSPVFVYATAAVFWLLGPSTAHLRLTAALFGIADVWLVGRLGRSLFDARSGLAAAVVLATAPWHVEVSRLGYEVASSLTPLLAGLLALSLWSRGGSWVAGVAGSALLAGTAYTYPAGRLLGPLLLVTMLSTSGRTRSGGWRQVAALLLVHLALLTPLVFQVVSQPAFLTRSRMLAIDDPSPLLSVAANWWRHLDPAFLFVHGDANRRHHVQQAGLGQLPWSVLPLLLAGLATLWHRRSESAARWVIAGLLLAPLPAALTREALPHALRSYAMLPFVALVCGVGASAIAGLGGDSPARGRAGLLLQIALMVGLSAETARFATSYFGSHARKAAWSVDGFQREEREINDWLAAHASHFDRVLETHAGRPNAALFHAVGLPPGLALRVSTLEPGRLDTLSGRVAIVATPAEAHDLGLDNRLPDHIVGDPVEARYLIYIVSPPARPARDSSENS